MKRYQKIKKYIKLVICFLIVFIATLLIEYFSDSSKTNMADLRHEVTKSILSSLIITLLLGAFTESITDDIMGLQRKDKKLRKYGIFGIGTGTISYIDERNMFGRKGKYPQELSFLFLSGNQFLKHYEDKLTTAIENGCDVRLLVVRPLVDGRPNEYVARYARICPSAGKGLAYEVCQESIPALKRAYERAKARNPEKCGSIEIRTYVDEFRNNQRFSCYGDKKDEIFCWTNVQSTHITALNLSLLLRGEVTSEDLEDGELEKTNLMFATYKSFESLWNLYPNSEPGLDDWKVGRTEGESV